MGKIMSRRIWVAEGVANDGDIYGRALRMPDAGDRYISASGDSGTGVQRKPLSVLKSHLGDIPSCPCLAALVTQDEDSGSLMAGVADA